jgi:hypothetical protein
MVRGDANVLVVGHIWGESVDPQAFPLFRPGDWILDGRCRDLGLSGLEEEFHRQCTHNRYNQGLRMLCVPTSTITHGIMMLVVLNLAWGGTNLIIYQR